MTTELRILGGFELVVDGRSTDALKSRPTCSAMLIHLAVERKVTRDSLLALLWPEADEARARHALSQTLYQLRRILGRTRLPGRGQELRLAETVSVDTVTFEDAIRRDRSAEAVELYGGPLLKGWHFRGPPSFQHWLDGQVERFASLYRAACRDTIAACLNIDDRAGARRWAEQWADLEPDGREAHRALIRLLVADCDLDTALERYTVLERRLAESGLVPGPEIEEAIAPARARRSPLPAPDTRTGALEPRIIVLPFTHVGPARFSRLTYGLANETTVRLARHPGLAVVARSSAFTLGTTSRSPRAIGQQLNVDYVLEATVRWLAEGRAEAVVVDPRLTRVSDGRQLWSAQLDTDHQTIRRLHIRLADRALSAIGLSPLTPKSATEPSDPGEPAAYEFYLRGLQHWHQRSAAGLRAAIDLFIRAIEVDSGYARAYAGLALAYVMMPSFLGDTPGAWVPRARHAVNQALRLDPDSAEGHLAMGVIAWTHDLDSPLAGRHWNRALELKPSNAQALVWLAYRSTALRRADEARERLARALVLDPLSLSTNFDAGLVSWHLRDRTQALAQMRRVLQMDPEFMPAAFLLGTHHMARNEIDAARREWARIRHFGPSWESLLGHLDDPERAIAAIDRIVEISPRPVHWYAVAILYVLFGAPERAIHWIEVHLRSVRGEPVAYPTGGPGLFHAVCDPSFDALRSVPRFQVLMRAFRLEEEAR